MKNNSQVRVRFAPSPTGYLHIGGLRTALFNWLYARHTGGKFLLRIEDTDFERSKPEYTQAIMDAFAWVDVASDEPVVIQSERKARHLEVANRLLVEGKAYKCFCSAEELRERLGENAAFGEGYTRYDGRCRDRKPCHSDTLAASAVDTAHVIRFRVPTDIAEIAFTDVVHGPITFPRDQFDDFIIVRSDGSPMYNFVVVVDDADMRITHVIRGEDHISNTPKQILLATACGFSVPVFAHVPMILGADGQRLSKRHAATAVGDYQRAGFLAPALCNYLVRLGWSAGDQELFTRDELIALFSLEGIGRKGSIFDPAKLEWVNSVYLKQYAPQVLVELIERDVLPGFRAQVSALETGSLLALVVLYQERVKTLRELAEVIIALLAGPSDAELAQIDSVGVTRLERCVAALLPIAVWDKHAAEKAIKEVCVELGVSLGAIAPVVRIALTGKTASPGIFDLFAALGKDLVITRIERAYARHKEH